MLVTFQKLLESLREVGCRIVLQSEPKSQGSEDTKYSTYLSSWALAALKSDKKRA
jgi:hypothetical protein